MPLQQHHHILLQCLPLMLLGTAVDAHTVSIQPKQLFVELGSAFNLSCSTDCPEGEASWVAQDDSDFITTEVRQGSILSVSFAQKYHAGQYSCTSKCNEQYKRATVPLNVFSFPNPTLSVIPLNPASGQPVQVNCTVSAVYCSGSYKVDISMFGEAELSGSVHELCDELNVCSYTLLATDQREGERVHYGCLAQFTVSSRSISKTANATIHLQDTRAESQHGATTPTMDSLTPNVTSRDPVTETSTVENINTTVSTHPDNTPDTVYPHGHTTSSQPITVSPQREGSTTQNQGSRANSNPVESNAMKAEEHVPRFTTSIIGISATLSFSFVGIVVAYLHKYGRKLPPCLGSCQRKENTSFNDIL